MHHTVSNEKLRAAGYPCLMDYYVRLHVELRTAVCGTARTVV